MDADHKTLEKLALQARKYSKPFRVTNGKSFRLKNFDPGDTLHLDSQSRSRARSMLAAGIRGISEYQERLYAQDHWAVLLIFQAMDAAGKDGAIKHAMSGVNPQGCQVFSFKAPSAEELDHDFMWRCLNRLPERGRIGIFNRSYYEETLIVRVHRELLERQPLPPQRVGKNIWKERFEDIRNIEKYLARNGVVVCKFFLYVSKQEQLKRFLSRLDEPQKNWKFSAADVKERRYWDDYMAAYEDMIRNTATKDAPWHVVPADNKWFTRLVVAATIVDTLHSLDLKFPKVGAKKRKELQAARKLLLAADHVPGVVAAANKRPARDLDEA